MDFMCWGVSQNIIVSRRSTRLTRAASVAGLSSRDKTRAMIDANRIESSPNDDQSVGLTWAHLLVCS